MLALLGIPFKRSLQFWTKNETQLEYLYDDFIRESKKLKCRLHPDHGGDPELFMRFNTLCLMAANAFRTRGVGPQSAIDTMFLKQDGATRRLAKAKFNQKTHYYSARH